MCHCNNLIQAYGNCSYQKQDQLYYLLLTDLDYMYGIWSNHDLGNGILTLICAKTETLAMAVGQNELTLKY